MRRGAAERDGDEMADAHDTAHASAITHRRGIASGTCILPNCYEATGGEERNQFLGSWPYFLYWIFQ